MYTLHLMNGISCVASHLLFEMFPLWIFRIQLFRYKTFQKHISEISETQEDGNVVRLPHNNGNKLFQVKVRTK